MLRREIGTISIQFPAPPDAAADVERLRAELGEEELTYALVSFDNNSGIEPLTATSVTVLDRDGRRANYRSPMGYVGDWALSLEPSDPKYAKADDAYNSFLNSDTAMPRQRRSTPYASNDDIGEIATVRISGEQACKD